MDKIKHVEREYYKGHRAPILLDAPSFDLPEVPLNIDFSIPQLCASIARCGNSSSASGVILEAQAKAAEEFIKLFVCPNSKNFSIIKGADVLIDAKLVSLAHDVGVGVAHLCMEEMGYSWKASGAEVLSGKKKKPDYIYDNGLSADEVVAMESKGSIAKSVYEKTVMGRAEKGYKQQLSPWLGKRTKSGSKIAHGYSVGTWAPIGKKIAKVGVHETTWPNLSNSHRYENTRDEVNLDRGVALSNYISNFRLLGSVAITSQLQFLQRYRKPWFDQYNTEEFLEIPIMGRPFLVSIPSYRFLLRRPQRGSTVLEVPDIKSYLYASTFALDLDMAKSLMNQIWHRDDERINLPVINSGILSDIKGSGEIAMFKDGLALLPPGYIKPDSAGRVFQWSYKRGLLPITSF